MMQAVRAVALAALVGCSASQPEPKLLSDEEAAACLGDDACLSICQEAEASGHPDDRNLCTQLINSAQARDVRESDLLHAQGGVDMDPQPTGAASPSAVDRLLAPNRSTRPLTPEEVFSASVRSLVAIEHDTGLGSGFVISSRGLVVTNVHVLAGATNAKITLMDGRELPIAHVVAFDEERDVMVLRVKGRARAIPLASHNRVVMAQQVFALGNPRGLMATISEGLVSGVRKLNDDFLVLQVTAPIAPGSSGGPLFDKYGNVIGVATAGLSGGGDIGFGVPVRYVKDLLKAPKKISLKKFAELTGRQTESDLPLVPRDVPKHDVTLLSGCSQTDYGLMEKQLAKAIEIGAPLYNKKEFSAALHIYEGALLDLERKLGSGCRGPKQALAEGRKQMKARKTDAEKVWALRDAFDGLLNVVERLKAQPRTQ